MNLFTKSIAHSKKLRMLHPEDIMNSSRRKPGISFGPANPLQIRLFAGMQFVFALYAYYRQPPLLAIGLATIGALLLHFAYWIYMLKKDFEAGAPNRHAIVRSVRIWSYLYSLAFVLLTVLSISEKEWGGITCLFYTFILLWFNSKLTSKPD